MSEDASKLSSVNNIIYEGRDLESMSFALNYRRWILELFDPYLGSRVVEVGAGSGSCSELLLTRKLESLIAVEPSGDMFQLLKTRLSAIGGPTQISLHNLTFRQVSLEISSEQPDSILYINVLEHIAEDEQELSAIHKTLGRGVVSLSLCPRSDGCMAVLTSESGTSDVTLNLNWSRNVSEPVSRFLNLIMLILLEFCPGG